MTRYVQAVIVIPIMDDEDDLPSSGTMEFNSFVDNGKGDAELQSRLAFFLSRGRPVWRHFSDPWGVMTIGSLPTPDDDDNQAS